VSYSDALSANVKTAPTPSSGSPVSSQRSGWVLTPGEYCTHVQISLKNTDATNNATCSAQVSSAM
jgi:hypothetical protein